MGPIVSRLFATRKGKPTGTIKEESEPFEADEISRNAPEELDEAKMKKQPYNPIRMRLARNPQRDA